MSTAILMALYLPTILVITILWAPTDLGLLFFSYIIPVIPFALWFDGVISSLRTRTFDEVLQLIDGQRIDVNGDGDGSVSYDDWTFKAGWKMHTWPVGYMNYIVGRRLPSMLKKSR